MTTNTNNIPSKTNAQNKPAKPNKSVNGVVNHHTTLTQQYNSISSLVQAIGPLVLFDSYMLKKVINHDYQVDEETMRDEHLDALALHLKQGVFQETNKISAPSRARLHKVIKWLKDNPHASQSEREEKIEHFNANITREDIYQSLQSVCKNAWQGYEDVVVLERDGAYWIQESKNNGKTTKDIEVTNYLLQPMSKIEVHNQDISKVYSEFLLCPQNPSKSSLNVFLNTDDFNTVKNLQDAIGLQAGIVEPRTFFPQSHMRGLSYKLTDLDWVGQEYAQKKGTTVLGYERFKGDLTKYFCTPSGKVYTHDGTVAENVVFVHPKIRLDDDDESSTDIYGNMKYTEQQWPKVLKFVAQNFLKLNKKDVMLKLGGFFFSTVHEYNIRQAINEFPIFHVAGQPGSGKTLTVGALAPFFGHASHTINNYPPSTPALSKMLTVSYTIPLICDEYGGGNQDDGWDSEKMKKVHAIMKNVYIKGIERKLGRGEGGQGQFRYKMRNPLLSLGQRFIQADSITDRTIQVSIDGSLKGTSEGDTAKHTADLFRDFKDKNFIVGYSLWSMRQDDDEVKDTVKMYLKANEQNKRANNLDISERQMAMLSAIQTGLHFFLKLCKEFKLDSDVGYSSNDVYDLIYSLDEFNSSIATQASKNPLEHFLQDFATHLRTRSMHSSGVYGEGNIAMVGQRTSDTPGQYGRGKAMEACVYTHKFVAIKLELLITELNRSLHNSKEVHTFGNIQPYLNSAFERAKRSGGDGLVLAPSQFKLNVPNPINGERSTGRYTLLRLDKLAEIDEVFEHHPLLHGNGSPIKTTNRGDQR